MQGRPKVPPAKQNAPRKSLGQQLSHRDKFTNENKRTEPTEQSNKCVDDVYV